MANLPNLFPTVLIVDDAMAPIQDALAATNHFQIHRNINDVTIGSYDALTLFLTPSFVKASAIINSDSYLVAVFLDKTLAQGERETGMELYAAARLQGNVRNFFSISKGFSLFDFMQRNPPEGQECTISYLGKDMKLLLKAIRKLATQYAQPRYDLSRKAGLEGLTASS